MSETLIKVEGVSKKFCRSLKKSLWYGLQDLGREITGRKHGGNGELRPDEFWAVKNASFEIKRGECLGLIGHNGAGKTTMLKMLNGLIKPESGRVELHGRIGALIALGAGFNPILTGRENIYTNAAVLGIDKQTVDRKFEEILDFAEIGEFIDMPVQNYSSGMNVRLGFAVAVILIEPDILFLDEVLAVGDIGFTIKCLNAVRKLSAKSAVVFVSHNMQFVSSFCTRVIVMNHGQVLLDAQNPAKGIDRYFSLMNRSTAISGTSEAHISYMDLMVDNQIVLDTEPVIEQYSDISLNISIQNLKKNSKFSISLQIDDESMTPILTIPVVNNSNDVFEFSEEAVSIKIPIGLIELNAGQYSFVIAVIDCNSREVLMRAQGLKPFRVYSKQTYWGKIVRPVIPIFN